MELSYAFGENKAPIATPNENIYTVRWSNETGNNEVMFRPSIDWGIHLMTKSSSNTTGSESADAEIATSGTVHLLHGSSKIRQHNK